MGAASGGPIPRNSRGYHPHQTDEHPERSLSYKLPTSHPSHSTGMWGCGSTLRKYNYRCPQHSILPPNQQSVHLGWHGPCLVYDPPMQCNPRYLDSGPPAMDHGYIRACTWTTVWAPWCNTGDLDPCNTWNQYNF